MVDLNKMMEIIEKETIRRIGALIGNIDYLITNCSDTQEHPEDPSIEKLNCQVEQFIADLVENP